MKIIAQMDEMLNINIATDSTFAILLAVQNYGCEIFYYLPKSLYFDLKTNSVKARTYRISLNKIMGNHCKILSEQVVDLTTFDAILIRQDPPFDINYITSTYILEKIKDKTLIINDPTNIRNHPEKIFINEFPNLITPTAITGDFEEVKNFIYEHQKIVMKPLYSCGGDGVVVLKYGDKNLSTMFEMMVSHYQAPVMLQKFIDEVAIGDKRILLLDGEPIGALLRVAKDGDNRCNLHLGGRANFAELTKRDLEICNQLSPKLKERGLFLVGIDIIGDYLTEINLTSPTCINEINQLNGSKIEDIIVEKIISKIQLNKKIKNFN